MPSSHLILCHPLLLLPPILPSIRFFSNDSTLCMRWPKYWSFSFSIIPSKVYWYINLDERRRGRNCTQTDTESSTYVLFWLLKTWGLQIKEKTVVKGQKYLLFLALSISRQDKAWGTKIFPDSIVLSQWRFFLDSDIRVAISFCFWYFFFLPLHLFVGILIKLKCHL